MYSCGPGTDRRPHAGQLRAGLLADLIRRNAEHRHGLTVLTCQNATRAGSGEDAFRADCAALNFRPADHSPRAPEWIGLITDTVAGLIEAGHARSASDGSVNFDVESFPGFGDLSGTTGNPRDDWELWAGTPGDDGEPAWPAPWGTGRPGRSAECSALSRHYLGDVIDVHTGGIGLRFPHHEQERAVSNSVTGHEVVRHWVHGEHTRFDGQPMAGAVTDPGGPVLLVTDLADRGLDPLALRLAFLGQGYRQPADLTWDTLEAADGTLRRWRELVAEWACSPSKPIHAPAAGQIAAAFDDDLDTPAALRSLHQLEQDPEVAPGAKFESFAHADQLLGLDLARDIGRAPARPTAQRNDSRA